MKNLKLKKDNGICGNCGEYYRDCECATGPNKD